MPSLLVYGAAAAALSALAGAALNQRLRVARYRVRTAKLSAPVRLALLSDHHGTRYGKHQQTLLAQIRAERPDLILLAGDIFDDHPARFGQTQSLLEGIGRAYPCFYAAGNHEFRTGQAEELKNRARACGITVLSGSGMITAFNGQALYVAGIDDPTGADWNAQLANCRDGLPPNVFSLLISHRPERAADYRNSGFDLVLCGHAHGGQVRIPLLVNGLYAPNQGLFPRYAGGLYALEGGTDMIVSRGLARNLRVFNRPELVIADLLPAAP